jgi:hypothetical protein
MEEVAEEKRRRIKVAWLEMVVVKVAVAYTTLSI